MNLIPLSEAVTRLQKVYGRPKPPLSDPWLLVLWENVAYLADDDHRERAFAELKEEVGTAPDHILAAKDEILLAIGRHGIVAKQSVVKLRRCAQIARDEFDGDLQPVLKMPIRDAKKALMRFPGIGEPGAVKILLFCGSNQLFGLESNGLRVLLRLGYGQDNKNYATMYKSVQTSVSSQLKAGAWRIRAHQLLRYHGQKVCRRAQPLCQECPLAPDCSDYQVRLGRLGPRR